MSIFSSTVHKHLASPPMGWNSWDCYGASINEEELLANARVMADQLLEFGWDTFVCDIQWSEPTADGWNYHAYAKLTIDEYGRQWPAIERFPSAVGGVGFKKIADEVHGLGMLFGVHLMRGIPRQAVHENCPIKGTKYTARDIADRTSICYWNTDMYGVNMTHPAAQAYYDSVFELFASWGVDYVKVDDIAWNFMAKDNYCKDEVRALHHAIINSGRKMTLSLSPGPAQKMHETHMSSFANCWRITDDFWDNWPLLLRALEACEVWSQSSKKGNWPDADMLPFGMLRMRDKNEDAGYGELSHFTDDEMEIVFRMWCIFRSPLFIGADLPTSPEKMFRLLQDRRLIEWNQKGSAAVLLSEPGDACMIWTQEEALGADSEFYDACLSLVEKQNSEGKLFPLLVINRGEESISVRLEDIVAKNYFSGLPEFIELIRSDSSDSVQEQSGQHQLERVTSSELQIDAHSSRAFYCLVE